MPSNKQKSDRKRLHKHKRKNRSRSSFRRHNIQKKNEGKKENIPQNACAWFTDLRDISTYMENRQEMIRQMFSSVEEDFLDKSVPFILKQATREELKRICFEELTSMSADIVFKILEGLPYDVESNITQKESAKERKHNCLSPQNCVHTSELSSEGNCWRPSKYCEEKELALGAIRGEDQSSILDLSSSEERQSDSEKDSSKISEDDVPDIINEKPSTSYQISKTKKLAKVAPFHISITKPEIRQHTILEEGIHSNELDIESSYEMVDLALEDYSGDEESESDSQEEVAVDEEFSQNSAHDEDSDSSQETREEEMQHNLSEMLELEHRARAIRSMLINMDRFKA